MTLTMMPMAGKIMKEVAEWYSARNNLKNSLNVMI
jgi:hypothetical protein